MDLQLIPISSGLGQIWHNTTLEQDHCAKKLNTLKLFWHFYTLCIQCSRACANNEKRKMAMHPKKNVSQFLRHYASLEFSWRLKTCSGMTWRTRCQTSITVEMWRMQNDNLLATFDAIYALYFVLSSKKIWKVLLFSPSPCPCHHIVPGTVQASRTVRGTNGTRAPAFGSPPPQPAPCGAPWDHGAASPAAPRSAGKDRATRRTRWTGRPCPCGAAGLPSQPPQRALASGWRPHQGWSTAGSSLRQQRQPQPSRRCLDEIQLWHWIFWSWPKRWIFSFQFKPFRFTHNSHSAQFGGFGCERESHLPTRPSSTCQSSAWRTHAAKRWICGEWRVIQVGLTKKQIQNFDPTVKPQTIVECWIFWECCPSQLAIYILINSVVHKFVAATAKMHQQCPCLTWSLGPTFHMLESLWEWAHDSNISKIKGFSAHVWDLTSLFSKKSCVSQSNIWLPCKWHSTLSCLDMNQNQGREHLRIRQSWATISLHTNFCVRRLEYARQIWTCQGKFGKYSHMCNHSRVPCFLRPQHGPYEGSKSNRYHSMSMKSLLFLQLICSAKPGCLDWVTCIHGMCYFCWILLTGFRIKSKMAVQKFVSKLVPRVGYGYDLSRRRSKERE